MTEDRKREPGFYWVTAVFNHPMGNALKDKFILTRRKPFSGEDEKGDLKKKP
jgi:hypothetical protein